MNTGSRAIDLPGRAIFESELQRATDMVLQGNARFWLAYCRGLRRSCGGPDAVSDCEHERWLRLHPALHPDELAGYTAALEFATKAGTSKTTEDCTGEELSAGE